MPLNKQYVDIPTISGIDTKTDSVNDTPPALSDLNNLRFTNTGAYDPRPSFDDLQALSATSTGFIAEARDSALSLVDGYLYKTVNGTHTNLAPTWAPLGRNQVLGGTYNTSASAGGGCTKPTSVTLSDGTVFVAWDNLGTNIGYQFLTDQGELLVAGQQSFANSRFLCVTAGPTGSAFIWITNASNVVSCYQVTTTTVTAITVPSFTGVEAFSITYSSTDSCWYAIISNATNTILRKLTISGTTISTASSVTVSAATSRVVDVIRSTTYVAVGYWEVGTEDVIVTYYNTSLTLVASQSRSPTATAVLEYIGFGICEIASDAIACSVSTFSAGSGMTLHAYRFTTAAAANIWDSISVGWVSPAAPICINSRIYLYAVDASAPGSQSSALIQIANYDGGTVSQFELASQWGADTTSLSETYFIFGASEYNLNSRMSKTTTTLTIPHIRSGTFQFIAQSTAMGNVAGVGSSRILTDYSVTTLLASVMQFQIASSPATRGYSLGSTSTLVSSVAKTIDGAGQSPSSPWPVPFPYTKELLSGGSLPLNTEYTYVFVKVWVDSLGNRHTLETLPIRMTTFDSTPDLNQFKFDFPVSAFEVYTTRNTPLSYASIEVYRTEGNGSIPYLLTIITVEELTLTDNTLDGGLNLRFPLPSSSGELTNTIVPGSRASTVWKGRLALLPFDSDNTIMYSKPSELYVAPSFAAGLEISIPQTSSPLTALGTMDGVLYAFTNNQVFTVYGDPAGNTGENSTLTVPEIRFNGIGCEDPASVILAPPGLFFKSAKGIYLILRNQELTFVGTGPFDERDETVVGTWVDETTSEVAFALDNGEIWVYDWEAKAWSRWTPPVGSGDSITGATLINNRPTYLTQDGIYQTVDSSTETFTTSMTTSWIRLGALQGYQRVYAMWLYLERLADHTLTVDMYIDGSETSVYTWTIVSTSLPSTNPEQIRLSVPIQKCSAIKLKISSTNAGWKLKGLMAEIGTKDSSFKSRNAPNNY
jgi:hypothetical protein